MNERASILANNMLQQLGGNNFLRMTGAKLNYLNGKDIQGNSCDVSLIIKLPNCAFNIHRIKIVEMILTFADNYTFKFYKRATSNPFKVVEDVYCEYVQDLFEKETNILVSSFNRKGSTIVIGRDVI